MIVAFVIIIFVDVTCYSMIIKDESVHLLFKILGS